MTITAAEQYLLELINRARLDPGAEAARLGIDLNAGLAAGTIGLGAQQVLTHNTALERAAQSHSDWMLAADVFSHTGANGSSDGDRIVAAGYVLTGTWRYGENLAWTGSTGSIDLNAAITQHYDGLFRSAGHRANTMDARYREIGIAQVEGRFTTQGNTYNASMLTENFATSGSTVFVTGVAYRDGDANRFYGIGEGLANVLFSAANARAGTEAAGGYRLGVGASSAVEVTISTATAVLAELRLDLSRGNGKLDLVQDALQGALSLDLSVSATLVSGIADARLLGIGNLALTGTGGTNRLTGNNGNNTLSDGGGTGADILTGARGNDIYVVNAAGTRIVETAGNGTADRVSAGISFVLAADDNIEIMTTTSSTGTRAINLTGNALFQTITGNDGDNILHTGGGAADVLVGRGGNDTYRVFHRGDQISESTGQGTADRVVTAVSFVLASDDNIEIMTTNGATGTAAINLTGNALAQSITGNAGANVLSGLGGNDTLTGGGGADAFVFAAALGRGNIDTLTDFNVAADTIRLENAVFTGLVAGGLAAAAFRSNTTGLAQDSTDRIIYKAATGELFFDADGLGGAAAVQFAVVRAGLSLTQADFLVI